MIMKYCLLSSLLVLSILSCNDSSSSSEQTTDSLIYYNAKGLAEVKQRITENDPYYTSAYEKLIEKADDALTIDADPVINKNRIPPSGDKQDYISIGPYWWEDSTKVDGLPWIRRDGEVNPLARGNDTDRQRMRALFNALSSLTFAFYYSDEPKYAEKAMDLMNIWLVDETTKVNPNVNYGQGVPGIAEGRPFGIIEWAGVDEIVNALQVFEQKKVLEEKLKIGTSAWLSDYLDWLLTSKLGKEEGARPNNHANWYDYQVLGISIYLGRIEDAKTRAEAIKTNRIAAQIEPDGSQPHELERTKSLSYSTMNLKAMTINAMLAQQVDVDVLHFEADSSSLLQAAEFLKPYVKKEKIWTHQQISEGGWEATIEKNVLPLFSLMSSIYEEPIFENVKAMKLSLSSSERLQYPPLLYE